MVSLCSNDTVCPIAPQLCVKKLIWFFHCPSIKVKVAYTVTTVQPPKRALQLLTGKRRCSRTQDGRSLSEAAVSGISFRRSLTESTSHFTAPEPILVVGKCSTPVRATADCFHTGYTHIRVPTEQSKCRHWFTMTCHSWKTSHL